MTTKTNNPGASGASVAWDNVEQCWREIVSRQDARERGQKSFFTGRPCKHGHVTTRAVSHGRCHECCRMWQRARFQADPETIRAQNRARYHANRERSRAIEREKARRRYARQQAGRVGVNGGGGRAKKAPDAGTPGAESVNSHQSQSGEV